MPRLYDGNHTSIYSQKDVRIYVLAIVFFLMAVIIILRLFSLQVLNNNYYTAQSERIHNIEKSLRPIRGDILVKEKDTLYPIVTNKDYYFVYADPRKIEDKNKFLSAIDSVIDLSETEMEELYKRLDKKDDPYEPIRKKVETDKMEKLKDLKIDGLYFLRENYRLYAEKDIGGHFLGFVDYNGNGKYGLEGFFNENLYGSVGVIKTLKDARGTAIALNESFLNRPEDGNSIILTIDKNIQYKACEEIKKGVATYEAKGGTAIVMDPFTGRVLAMCSVPDFDSENYNKIEDLNVFNNPAIFYAYEPGSIFKAITFSIGLDLNVISPKTTYEDTGEIKIIGHDPIRNSDKKAHGTQTMTQVLEKSLNTGAIYVVDKIGHDNFKKYVENFGFGDISGIELDTESPGNISSLSKHGQIYSMTASFGQGITVTSIQFITAFSALINGGDLLKPFIVEKIKHGDDIISETKPVKMRQVITSVTSSLITNMLVSVVENGYSGKAKIPGYFVGGKTGTAQVAGKDGKYSDETIHTFIGFAPAYNPKFVILVKMDDPKKFKFSSETATLVFKDIAEYIIRYYNIAPEREIK